CWARGNVTIFCYVWQGISQERGLVQRRQYPTNADRQRAYRKRKRKHTTPYFAARRAMHAVLTHPDIQAQKALQGLYDVLAIDPPWPVAFHAREARPQQISLAYRTMSLEAIQALSLPLADPAHVWLWTPQRFVYEAFACLHRWQLAYCCCFVWYKPGGMQPMGLPQFNCELALYARKGPALFLDTTDLPLCFPAARTAHSAKPEEFYAMVRRVTAGRRLDMFSRRRIDGFDSWGDEAPSRAEDAT